MITIDLQDGTRLSMCESIFEMRTGIYSEFRANELFAAGIKDIYANVEKTIAAIGDNDTEKAIIEAQNTYVALKHIEAKHDPEQVQFGWMIDKVNSDTITLQTNEERQKLVHELGLKGLTQQKVLDFLDAIKKK